MWFNDLPEHQQKKLKVFDENLIHFLWIVRVYDFLKYKNNTPWTEVKLNLARSTMEITELTKTLNTIWYSIPDDIFNIRVNPPGYAELLKTVEELNFEPDDKN